VPVNQTPETTESEPATARDRLAACLVRLAPERYEDLRDDSPVVGEGGLESMSLLRLYQWLEQETRNAIDITTLDVASEWRDVGSVLAFIERTRNRGGSGG